MTQDHVDEIVKDVKKLLKKSIDHSYLTENDHREELMERLNADPDVSNIKDEGACITYTFKLKYPSGVFVGEYGVDKKE